MPPRVQVSRNALSGIAKKKGITNHVFREMDQRKPFSRFLGGIHFFKGLSEKDLSKISRLCREEGFNAGEAIFLEGSKADRFFIIEKGTVEIWKDYESRNRELLAIQRSRGLFGEMALLDDLPRSATAVARDPTHVLSISRKDFLGMIQEDGSVAISIMKSLTSIIRKSNETFIQGLRERNRRLERANRELKETQEELLRAERFSTLGKFSSLILHDIRNPLSVLRIQAELILMDLQDRPKIAEKARKIISEADCLNGMANDLLDYCRGEIRLNLSPVDLEEFISKLMTDLRVEFSTRRIVLQSAVLVEGPVVMDEQRMYRVFTNLASNARKAMPDGGVFSIKVKENGRSFVFDISDTGVGMSQEVKKKIFEPFFSSAQGGGTGLGMSIVKSIVDAHLGSISVKTQRNAGTTFTIVLPKLA